MGQTNAGHPPIVGRLAPSPTGGLHLGHARTFLLAWLAARSAGGRVVLRIEDIDVSRVRPEATQGAIDDLRWLGLDWDDGPYLQSERLADYELALDRLKAMGLVYPCTCTRADIARAASAPHAEDEGPSYPGTCAGRTVAEASRLENRPFAWRFRVSGGSVGWEDLLKGPIRVPPQGDFLVARSGGAPAYQLAVVCDDAAMGVNQVIRGDDLIASTPRQVRLYAHLGWKEPAFGHLSLVNGPDGRRLAKRDASLKLSTLRESGVDPPPARRPPDRIAGAGRRNPRFVAPRCDRGLFLREDPARPVDRPHLRRGTIAMSRDAKLSAGWLSQGRIALRGLASLFRKPPTPSRGESSMETEVVSTDTQRERRIPPGQVRTKRWPVLHAGPTPRIDLASWDFSLNGLVEAEKRFSWDQFRALPALRVHADMHCVTRWSMLDNGWEGVLVREVMKHVRLKPEAKFALIHAENGYTTNLALDDFLGRIACSRGVTTGRRWSPITGGRCDWSCPDSMRGRARSGCGAWNSWRRIGRDSGRRTAITTTAIRGARNASGEAGIM